MVLQFTSKARSIGSKSSGPSNNRDNIDRSMQDNPMTDNVVDFPKATGLDDYFGIMGAYDLELTQLTTKALELGLDVHTIVGLLQAQAQFLISLELYEDEE